MKFQDEPRFCSGFCFLIDLNGNCSSFALLDSSYVSSLMAFVSNMCIILLQFSYGWDSFVQGFVYLVLLYFQGFTIKKMVDPCKTYVRLFAVLMGSGGLTKDSLFFSITLLNSRSNPQRYFR